MKPGHLFFPLLLYVAGVSGPLSANEIYLMGAYQAGGDFERASGEEYELDDAFAFSVVASIEWVKDQPYDFVYSYQSTDLIDSNAGTNLLGVDIHYLHFGSTVVLDQKRGWDLFILGTLGLSHFSPSRSASAETAVSMAIGAGMKKNIGDNLILRADARLYSTYYGSGATLFCVDDDCNIPADGDLETQLQLNIGLGFKLD